MSSESWCCPQHWLHRRPCFAWSWSNDWRCYYPSPSSSISHPPPPFLSQIALVVGTTSDLKYDPIFYGRLRSTLGTPITIGKTRSQSTVSKKLPQWAFVLTECFFCSVFYSMFMCHEYSGKHRSLAGPQLLHPIRNLDSWSEIQLMKWNSESEATRNSVISGLTVRGLLKYRCFNKLTLAPHRWESHVGLEWVFVRSKS